MDAYDMLRLVPHPTVPGAYTFAHAVRGYRYYRYPAPTYFFDHVVNDEFFFVKSTVVVQKDGRIVNSYYIPKNSWRFYSFDNILEEMKKYYGVKLPDPERIKYFDYTRLHAVYDDGTTLKISGRRPYKLPPSPLAEEAGLDIYYVTEGSTYATITGAEVLRISEEKAELIIGYTKVLDLAPDALYHLAEIKNPKDLFMIISLL